MMTALPPLNTDQMVNFLVDLLNTPSPTGDTAQAISLIREKFDGLGLEMAVSLKGYLTGTLSGEKNDRPRGVTAHVDTLGGMVSKIKKNGRLQLTQLGGWIWNSVEGEGVTVFASDGKIFRGALMPVTASIHAHTREEGNARRSEANMEVRLDARTTSRTDTQRLGIRVGDIVAFDPRVEVSETGYIRSRHLDDKASIACMYGALAALKEAGLQPAQKTIFHISNYEEVGHGAAAGWPADLTELVTVDMAVVAPEQQSTEHHVTICAKDSGGPYHLGLRRRLEKLAESCRLPYQTDIYPYYGSDGTAFWRAGGDVAVGLIGPGVDGSHHYERTHIDALQATADLIMAYLLDSSTAAR